MKLPLFATEYYAYSSVINVKSIKHLTIIKAKMGQNGRRFKCTQLFMKLSVVYVLPGLESNYGLYRLQS